MPEPLLLNGDRPLVLFPVRLETRFFGQELRIRVFPDKIHVDTHEPELTADEVEWGKHFHTLLWNATTEEARKDAWQQLADRYGARPRVVGGAPVDADQSSRAAGEAAEVSVAAGAPGGAERTKPGLARRARACCRINGSPRRSCKGAAR